MANVYPLRMRAGLRRLRSWLGTQAAEYMVYPDQQNGSVYIRFQGKLERSTMLALHAELEQMGDLLQSVYLDVTQAQGLTVPSLAPLVMLCTTLERKRLSVILSGIPEHIRLAAIASGMHFIVNLE